MAAVVAAFAALADADPAAFVAAVDALGILTADAATQAHGLLREVLGAFVEGEATLDAAAVRDVTERAFARMGDLLALAGRRRRRSRRTSAPARMLGQLAATLARYGVTADWPALVARAGAAGP